MVGKCQGGSVRNVVRSGGGGGGSFLLHRLHISCIYKSRMLSQLYYTTGYVIIVIDKLWVERGGGGVGEGCMWVGGWV